MVHSCKNCAYFVLLVEGKAAWGECHYFKVNNPPTVPMWSTVTAKWGHISPDSGVSCKTWEPLTSNFLKQGRNDALRTLQESSHP